MINMELCMDFKHLNKLTLIERWPLYIVQEMLRRISEKKPKFFTILDLTSGYHRRFTAFLTDWGVFEWLQMPIYLAGAAVVTVVLAGLVMVIFERYLVDEIYPS
jgi:hypothetical protein